MTEREAAGVRRATWEVLDYFVRNPDAADDAVGIARWRLLDERIHRSLAESRAALARLANVGFLVVEPRVARTIFRLNRERAEEAAEYLRRHPPG